MCSSDLGRRFAIRGSHLEGGAAPAGGRIALVLDAGVAFGSGEHGSTRGCLRALERIAHLRPRRILDLGTGSGILAMAAAKLLHRRVLATDIEPWSVRITRENAARNGVGRLISAHLGNDYRRARIGIGHPGVKELVHSYVLSDFAKSEKGWVDTICEAIAENAAVLAKGPDASFQNKVHLAMEGRGWGEVKRVGEK